MPSKDNASNKKESTQTNYDSLHRSEKNKVIAGVSGGLGEYFGIDPTIIRIIFILLTVFGGSGILIYLILWFIMPPENYNPSSFGENSRERIKGHFHQFAHDLRATNPNSRLWFGFILIILGLVFFANNLGIFYFSDIGRLWPLILVLLGLSLLGKRV